MNNNNFTINIPNHETTESTGIVRERMINLRPGEKMGDLPEELQHKSFVRTGNKKTGGPNMRLLRLENDQPSLTITAYIFHKFVHPTENRYITPREAALLQDFPIDYEFKGTLGEVQMQIGNAVPVRLAHAIAQAVAQYLQKLNQVGICKIASYFTGAGGLDLGFESASNNVVKFETSFATDIAECVEATIKHNRPQWNFYRADLTELNPSTVREIIGRNPDIIIGGPPCQPFSVAGKQKGTGDRLGILYQDYIRHIDYLKPQIVIMENVYGLAQIKSSNMMQNIYQSFAKIGYQVTHKELIAADYGTPQKRRRLFFVAAKNLEYFQYPEPTHCETENLLGLPLYNGAGEILKQLPKPLIRSK